VIDVDMSKKKLTTIGGNVDDTLGKRIWNLKNDGTFGEGALPHLHHRMLAVTPPCERKTPEVSGSRALGLIVTTTKGNDVFNELNLD